jgi:Fe2+ or Zn2+ uptake regulation protein
MMIQDGDNNGLYHHDHQHHHHHPHVIARYKETIVTIANREQEADRTVAAQKEELQ